MNGVDMVGWLRHEWRDGLINVWMDGSKDGFECID